MGDISRVQGRKWQITINNPSDHKLDHEAIKAALSSCRSLVYYCLCDEMGDECATLHTHVFFVLRSPCTAARVDSMFPSMHRERAMGTCAQNRSYVLKDGDKYNKQSDGRYHYEDSSGKTHDGINYSDTFEEWGEMPVEHQGKSNSAEIIVNMIRDGFSNAEIVDAVASAYKDIDKIDRTRSIFRDRQFADQWRDLEVVYIFGATGMGKTRSVMDKFGYANCYRVTDYKHPFDQYDGQDIIIFEEFRSGLKHGDMLNYLDGYPLLLPCRYFNRQACYTKVFIITNIPPEQQYLGVDDPSRAAFFRRIHKVIWFQDSGVSSWNSITDYFNRFDWACGHPDEQLKI